MVVGSGKRGGGSKEERRENGEENDTAQKKLTLSLSRKCFKIKISSVGLLMALTLHFGNVVYLFLTVSFIQMLKAFTPVVTMGEERE